MSTKTWNLIDREKNLNEESLSGEAGGCKFSKRRLRGGLSEGVDVVRVDNGTFSFDVLLTRGMSVWKGWLGDVQVGWNSPVPGPVHPAFVPLREPSGLGWLDGFDELLVRCGLESNGGPEFDDDGRLKYALHGRIANKPAHKVDVSIGDSGEISVTGVVDEVRFHFSKLRLSTTIQTRPGESGFRIYDEVENLSGSPGEMQMLYHINFGPPFLDEGARLVAPVKTLVPRNDHAASDIGGWDTYAAEQAGSEEQVYFMNLAADADGDTQVLLKNAAGKNGVSLHFNTAQLPCLTVWKNTTSPKDGYVTGIEPGTNFPNPRSYEGEQNRVVKLPPGGKYASSVGVEVHADVAAIEKAEESATKLQADTAPQVFDAPQAGWCAP